MRNEFPGICYRCGERVEAKQGHFERVMPKDREAGDKVKWRLQHAECAIKHRGTNVGKTQEQVQS